MKKNLSAFISLLLVVVLTGCSVNIQIKHDSSSTTGITTSSPEVTTSTPGTTEGQETTAPSENGTTSAEITTGSAPVDSSSKPVETEKPTETEKPIETEKPVETEPHVHNVMRTEKFSETEHKLICSCGEAVPEAHAFSSWTVMTPATATTDGERYRQCVSCGYSQTEVIPALSHVHEYDGYSYNESQHWSVCKICKEISPSGPHFFGVWTTVAPTTEQDGSRTRSCTECGYTETEIIPKLEHVHSFNWTYNETVHYTVCECGQKGPESEHNFGAGWVETIPATETSEGMKERTCISCGYVQKEAIPKTEKVQLTPVKGRFEVNCHENGYLKLILVYESVSFTENELVLNVKMLVSAYNVYMGKRNASVTLGGETVNFTTSEVDISSSTRKEVQIGEQTITVPLASTQKSVKLSGTLDLNITFSGKNLTSQTVSNYIALRP